MEIDFNKPTKESPHPIGNGTQKIWRFPNGYGASVVQFHGSYGFDQGKWELGIIQFTDEDSDDYGLTFATEISDDVIGYLNESEVEGYLKRIEKLKSNKQSD